MRRPTRAHPALPPILPDSPTTTADVPSGYCSILLQIRAPHGGVHPLDLPIGVHARASGCTGPTVPDARRAQAGAGRTPRRDDGGTMRDTSRTALQTRLAYPRRRPGAAEAIRRFCLDCLGATSGRGAFDCQSRICPLYQASPFRRAGRRRASKGLVVDYCRHCQPGDQSDCGAEDCALYPWRPWQPGGQPKARRLTDSQKQRLRQIGQASQFAGARQ